jgi:hypothetical protein
MRVLYSSKGEVETFFLSLLFYKTLLAADWNICSNLAKASQSHSVHQKETKDIFLNEDHNPYALEHMARKEQMDF